MYIAHRLHWSVDSVLDFEHPARNRVLAELAKLELAKLDDTGT